MTRAFHRLQSHPNACVCAALASALAACGVQVDEAGLSAYTGSELFDRIEERLAQSRRLRPTASWVEIPWLGLGSRADCDDPSFERELSAALSHEDVACVVLEAPFRAWLALVERSGLTSPYGASAGATHNHAFVVFGTPEEGQVELLDPWSNPEGQPLRLSLDEVLELAPLGVLLVLRSQARAPREASDRL